MAGTVKKLQFSEGTDVGAPSDLSLATSTTVISAYADDSAYVSANGAAVSGSAYVNSTLNVMRYYANSQWHNALLSTNHADPTKKMVLDLSGNTTAKTATLLFGCTLDRTYTFPDVALTVLGEANTVSVSNKTLDNTNTLNVKDSLVTFQNNGDATKTFQVELSGITTGNLRKMTVPDADFTAVGLSTTQTLSAKSFSDAPILKDGIKVEDPGAGTNYVKITSPTLAGNWTLTLPVDDGTPGQVLQTDGDGITSWQSVVATGTASPTAQGLVTSYFPTIQSAVKTLSSAGYSVLTTDGYAIVEVSTGASDRTITLPAIASNTGRVITIIKTDNGAGTVIIDANSSETINGALTNVLLQQRSFITLFGGSSEWEVIAVSDYKRAVVGIGAEVTINSGSPQTIQSIDVPPGTWSLSCSTEFDLISAMTGFTQITVGIGTTNNSSSGLTRGDNQTASPTAPTSGSTIGLTIPRYEVTHTSTTTYYMIASGSFSTGSIKGFGYIDAVRLK